MESIFGTGNKKGKITKCREQKFLFPTGDELWQTKLSQSLSSIIRGFKIGVTKYCKNNNLTQFSWQKSFYDHIIRNEKSLINIKQYIIDNPKNWKKDELYV